MGMFDDVICDVDLPDGFSGPLQSKDFACELDRYTITKEGRLVRRYISGSEPVPESAWQHEYASSPDSLHQLWFEQSKTRYVYSECDMNFHGKMRFYAAEGKHSDGTWKWHEYRAKFTDGQLVTIEQVPETEEA